MSKRQHQPGEPHHYQIECEVCGERGTVRLAIDPETSPEDPGIRCPVYSDSGAAAVQCSRDEGHPGAHVHRAERGRGAIGWAPWAGERR